jgi:hypothetical protein
MTVGKEFDPELHRQWDQKAKQVIIDRLNTFGYRAREMSDPCAVDIWVDFNMDVEVKLGWGDQDFPFEDLQIPKRKERFMDEFVWFGVLNKPMNRMALVRSADYSEIRNVPNKYNPDGELFYIYPKERIWFCSLDEKSPTIPRYQESTGDG